MQAQNLIGQKLAEPSSIRVLARLLQKNPDTYPARYARDVCETFDFHDPMGRPQQSSCLAALRALEQKGVIAMPAPRNSNGGVVKPLRLEKPVEPPKAVPESADKIHELTLVLVEDAAQRATWNELIIREHPLGARPIVGRTLRYLVQSEHGYLGAIAFSSSAVALGPRDQWIGWDAELRSQHLDRVVSLSRFLIRPCLQCQYLASKVLGMAVKRMPRDYLAKYGVEVLLLETFVDPKRYRGTSFRAANWIGVGQTQGRGRQDREWKAKAGVKDIYMYPVDARFREKLGVQEHAKPLPVSEELGSAQWALREFGGAQLGHVDRVKRVVEMAEAKMRKPNATWLEVANGDRHQLKCIYRLLQKPVTSKVSMDGILKGHQERTIQRMAGQRLVLVAQDSTDLNFAEKLACRGLGRIGTNQTKTQTKGLRLHSSLALTEEGIPLGVLRADCYPPKSLTNAQKNRDNRQVPIEEKETHKWVRSVESCIEASKRMPQTMVVNVMDREGDVLDVFHRVQNEPRVHVLVRADHDRRLEEGPKLFEQVRSMKERGVYEVNVPRQSARRKKGKRRARKAQPPRKAKVAVRFMPFKLLPPKYGVNAKKKPIQIWVVHVKEKGAPKGVEPIEWFLLTTIKVESLEAAVRLATWYGKRWRIEDWHRVLKSGCEIQKYSNQSDERLRRAMSIDLVVGYRILLMVLLGREVPELPADALFSDMEIRVLSKWSEKKTKKKRQEGLSRDKKGQLTTIGSCVAVLAMLGGYLGRKTDPPVGPKILHRAYIRLQHMCEGVELFAEASRPEQQPGYG